MGAALRPTDFGARQRLRAARRGPQADARCAPAAGGRASAHWSHFAHGDTRLPRHGRRRVRGRVRQLGPSGDVRDASGSPSEPFPRTQCQAAWATHGTASRPSSVTTRRPPRTARTPSPCWRGAPAPALELEAHRCPIFVLVSEDVAHTHPCGAQLFEAVCKLLEGTGFWALVLELWSDKGGMSDYTRSSYNAG